MNRFITCLINKLDKLKNDLPSIIFYMLGITFILFSERDNLIVIYLGFSFFAIGAIIWLIKLYAKHSENIIAKILFWMTGFLSLPLSALLTNLGIITRLGFPASDFTNTQLLLATILYFPCWILVCLLFILSSLMINFILKYTAFFLSATIPVNPVKQYSDNWVTSILHMVGIFSIYVGVALSLKLFDHTNNFVLVIAEYIDYGYMKNYPNVPHDRKILIHNGNFFSEIKTIDGVKTIVTTAIK